LEAALGLIRLVHWKPEEAREGIQLLQSAGYEVRTDRPAGPTFLRELAADPPDAVVIDLGRLPSQGRDIGLSLRMRKGTRGIPLVFVGGDPDKVAAIRQVLPDAAYTEWRGIRGSLKQALSRPLVDPAVPKSVFAAYEGRSTSHKLGIKPGFKLALIDAPGDARESLGPMPEGVELLRGRSGRCDLAIWFVRSRRNLAAGMSKMADRVGRAPLWIAWPKKSSGLVADLSQQDVRDTGLGSGWVDYKICSIDATWSGLLFRQRDTVARRGKKPD
jgi:hypothetical protein